MLSFWPALPMGIFIAMISSIVGIGGGILWMPFLLLILKLNPEVAVLTSLMIQTVGMGSGSWAYYRNQRTDLKLALIMLLVTIPGIIAGAYLTRQISPAHIELILGLLAMTTAFLFVSLNHKYDDKGHKHAEISRAKPYLILLSLMSVVSGFLSVSVGEWLIPIMHGKMNLRMSTAIATSITTIFGVCLMGSAIHFILGGKPHWQAIAWAAPGVLIGGQIGPRIAEYINERMLKEIFIFLLTLVGIHMIYNAF
jgi:uncharacterized membrane protein YfcA